MRTTQIWHGPILLSLIATLSFLGCESMENSPTAVEPGLATPSLSGDDDDADDDGDADLRITEVMYSPGPALSDSRFEYFEITNFGVFAYTGDCDTGDFDPSTGLFFDNEADRFTELVGGEPTRHILCLREGQYTIQPGISVIFARSSFFFGQQFNPPVGCQVIAYSGSVSLNNNGDEIEVFDGVEDDGDSGEELASMEYDGTVADNDGNSLHLDLDDDDEYFGAPPTPCSFPFVDGDDD